MSLEPANYLQYVKNIFQETGNPNTAEGQMKYMRNQFEFYGLKAEIWIKASKQIFKEKGIPEGENLIQLIRLCFEDEYREIQYFALEMTQTALKKQEEDFIEILEELIVTKSWWDTVDWISKLVNIHFKRFPKNMESITHRWIESDNMWLQRTAIIFQRYYKINTNKELLFKYILRHTDSKEFFIQKAAGWSLREYSKVNPGSVINFIDNNPQLAPLTKREGLKWLQKRE